MVNYKLSVKDSKGFKEIVWNKQNYAKLDNHILENIDNFTSNFENTLELKKVLLDMNTMEYEDANKKLGIRYNAKGTMRLLQYELCLKQDKLFFEVDNIIEYLKNNKKDICLLEKLCNHYKNSYVNGNNIIQIRSYIYKYMNDRIDDESFKYIDNILENFVIRETAIYNSTDGTYGRNSDGTLKYNYRRIHDLAMFLAYDYKKRIDTKLYDKQNPKDKIEVPKILVRKKGQIPGQLSLFD